MATNSTDEDIDPPSITDEKVSSHPSTSLIGDPVFLAITGVILCFGIIFLVREIFSRIKNRRYGHHHQHRIEDLDTVPRNTSSLSPFTDEPPPYPGKYSKTNINYLPSYDSAIKMAPEFQINTFDDVMTPVLDENSDENGEDSSDHLNPHEEVVSGARLSQCLSRLSSIHPSGGHDVRNNGPSDDGVRGSTQTENATQNADGDELSHVDESDRGVGEETIVNGSDALTVEDE